MMKHLFLLTLIGLTASAQPIVLHTKAKPQKDQAQEIEEEDDDEDGKIVLANVANMLGCIGMLSTDPYNPAVAGPSLAQIGVSFINIITQIFKSHGFDDELTRGRIETWFMELPNQTKMEIINLFIQYANQVRSLHYCPQCDCDECSMARNIECFNCR